MYADYIVFAISLIAGVWYLQLQTRLVQWYDAPCLSSLRISICNIANCSFVIFLVVEQYTACFTKWCATSQCVCQACWLVFEILTVAYVISLVADQYKAWSTIWFAMLQCLRTSIWNIASCKVSSWLCVQGCLGSWCPSPSLVSKTSS